MRLLRWIQPFLWVASALAVAYAAWVFTGRLVERKHFQERVTAKPGSNPDFDRYYAGKEVRILQLYAREGMVTSGKSTLLCYGVLNATAVQMDPALSGIYPAVNRCLEIAPTRTTTYTLRAEGPTGSPVTQSVTVKVQ